MDYVSIALSRSVSNYEALRILEVAAKRLGISLRDLDTTIWESVLGQTLDNLIPVNSGVRPAFDKMWIIDRMASLEKYG